MKKKISRPKSKKTIRRILDGIHILQALGLPIDSMTERRKARASMAFLAVADLSPQNGWPKAKSTVDGHRLTSRQIINYLNSNFEEKISSGSYDDIRRQDLKDAVLADIIIKSAIDPTADTNDPTRPYALTPEAAAVVRTYGTAAWKSALETYSKDKVQLTEQLRQRRELAKIPIKLPDGRELKFSPGEHNKLQKAIIEEFLPFYGYGAKILYLGDSEKRLEILKDDSTLHQLGFFEIKANQLPDVLAYAESKNWLYLIEAVHSVNPISPRRYLELQRLVGSCTADIIYVTAFLTKKAFKAHAADIAWETEVWIAEDPEHLIHFNGDKFMGPHKKA